MRPYLAILKDSFREALASRVLWIVLVLISLLLVALLPARMIEHESPQLLSGDLRDELGLINKLKAAAASDAASPGKHIWGLLSADLKKRLDELPENPPTGIVPVSLVIQLRIELDGLLSRADFYDPTSWNGLPDAAGIQRSFSESSESSDPEQRTRRNRAALVAAFPAEIAPARKTSASFQWLGFDTRASEGVSPELLVNATIAKLSDILFGALGVFAGILVTASIIPHTFDAGAIDLLLSKPVSRSLVFLTKFAGGCAFILISAAYLFAGVWLICGFRLGVWNIRLLWCIPVYFFLFAIYYAVSALAGVLWRNAIVCVMISVLFWCVCAGLRFTTFVVENLLEPSRLMQVVAVGDDRFATDGSGKLMRWSAGEWEQLPQGDQDSQFVVGSNFLGNATIGPVYDAKHERLLAIHSAFDSRGNRGLEPKLFVASRDEHWTSRVKAVVPQGSASLLITSAGDVLIVAGQGVFRWTGKEAEGANDQDKPAKFLGITLPTTATNPAFEQVSEPLQLSPPFFAALNSRSGEIAIYDPNELLLLKPAEAEHYTVARRVKNSARLAGVVAFQNDTLATGLADGRIELRDPADLALRAEFKTSTPSGVRAIDISDDGRYVAAALHDHHLWLRDTVANQDLSSRIGGQGDINAASFHDGRLLVVDGLTRVSEYDTSDWQRVARLQPSRGALEKVYHFGIYPVYVIFPKPGELDRLTNYLLLDERSLEASRGVKDPSVARLPFDVWGPVRDNLIFLAVVLGLSCWYIHRKDF